MANLLDLLYFLVLYLVWTEFIPENGKEFHLVSFLNVLFHIDENKFLRYDIPKSCKLSRTFNKGAKKPNKS